MEMELGCDEINGSGVDFANKSSDVEILMLSAPSWLDKSPSEINKSPSGVNKSPSGLRDSAFAVSELIPELSSAAGEK